MESGKLFNIFTKIDRTSYKQMYTIDSLTLLFGTVAMARENAVDKLRGKHHK